MGSTSIHYHYTFALDDGRRLSFEITLNDRDLSMENEPPAKLPEWTRLGYMQCPNCPLSTETTERCPVAVNMVNVTKTFEKITSHLKALVTIQTPERTYMKECDVQDGLGTILGVVMSSSGCPVLDKLRPMVRTHLPFASLRENLYRAVSMYIMAQHLRELKNLDASYDLSGLKELYDNVKEINYAMSNRIAAHFKGDANINALVVLNCMAEFTSFTIEDGLMGELEDLFAAYYL